VNASATRRGDAPGRSDIRSVFLGHPGRSSIGGRACGPCPSCGKRKQRVSHKLVGRRSERAAHNGPQALSRLRMMTNDVR
jgi:hypothetical protein